MLIAGAHTSPRVEAFAPGEGRDVAAFVHHSVVDARAEGGAGVRIGAEGKEEVGEGGGRVACPRL
jgi:hypothetical protein